MSAKVVPISPAAALANASVDLAEALNPQLIAEQRAEIKGLKADAYRQRHALFVLDTDPEWILTGDPKHPTLWHLLMAAYSDGPVTDAEMSLRTRIAELRQKYLAPGGLKIETVCFRCGVAKSVDGCCKAHRLNEELRPFDCADCAVTVQEVGRAVTVQEVGRG